MSRTRAAGSRSCALALLLACAALCGFAAAGRAAPPPASNPERRDTPPHPPGVPPPNLTPRKKPVDKSPPPPPVVEPVPVAPAPAVTPAPAPVPAADEKPARPASPRRGPAGRSPARATPRSGTPVAAPPGTAGSRVPPAADALRTQSAGLPENAPVTRVGDVDWLAASDLARLLSATKYWHGIVRKLELRTLQHRIQLTADNPFVLLDDRTLQLQQPIRVADGQLFVPVAFIDSLPRDTTLTGLIHDARRGIVLRVPPEGLVRTLRVNATAAAVRLTFPTDRPGEAVVVGRGRAHFRLRFGGLFVGALPDSASLGGLLHAVRPIPVSTGSAFELDVAREAQGYRLEPTSRGDAVDLVIVRDAGSGPGTGYERFAPEGPEGVPSLRVVVLDPGHGGSDAGVTVGTAVEKNLTLALARELERELQLHLGARVVLTRTDDRSPTMQQRAEAANRAHADVVLSLHFDGAPSTSARGVTAYCPPATFGGAAASDAGPRPLELLPWRDVATRHAVRSRELAEAVLSALELRGLGPARLREQLPYPLLGVNAPGLLIECGTLTSDVDRARVTAPQGIADLARAIAAGLDAYRRAE